MNVNLNQDLIHQNYTTNKLEVIDGLRGLAILMVLYHHILKGPGLDLMHKVSSFFCVGQWIGVFALGGWLGVNLFFILSGFVLFRPYFLKQRKFENLGDVFAFYKKRFFRLYPLFTFSCLISFFFIVKPGWNSFKSLILTLSTFSTFTSIEFYPVLNGVLWTLVVEIWFSLLFPLIVFLLDKFSFKKIAILIFGISLFVRLVGHYYFPGCNRPNFITDGCFGRLDDFFLGMIICKLYYENNKILQGKGAVLFGLSLFLFFVGCLVGDLACTLKISYYFHVFMYNIIQLSFFCLIFAAFNLQSFINSIFRTWVLRILGAMCFSIYVWHQLLITSFLLLDNLIVKNIVVYLFFMLVFSAMSYRYIEFGKEKSLKKLFLLE